MDCIECLEEFAIMDMVIENDIAWFCELYHNALFQYDFITEECRLLCFLPNQSGAEEAYSPICYINDKLVIAPRNGDCILVYDLKQQKAEQVDLKMSPEKYNLFSYVKAWKNFVYFFPGKYPAIVRLNMDNMAVEYFEDWYTAMKPQFESSELSKIIFAAIREIDENRLMLPCWRNNTYMIFDCSNLKYDICSIGDNEKILADALSSNGIWYSCKKEPVIYYRNADNTVTYNLNTDENGFKLFEGKDYIYAVSLISNRIFKVHKSSGEIMTIETGEQEILPEMLSLCKYNNFYLCRMEAAKSKLVLYSEIEKKILIVDLNSDEIKDYKINIEENALTALKEAYNNAFVRAIKQRHLAESRGRSLTELIALLNEDEADKDNDSKADVSIGRNIYAQVSRI